MPPTGASPSAERPPTEAVRAVLAAKDRVTQSKLVAELAKEYHLSRDVLGVFNRLAAAPGGHRLALLFVEHMPAPIPSGLLLLAAPLLQARDVGPHLRVAVAGRLIGTLPDRPESIGPIVRALTAGLGKTRTLERLIQLQSRVEKSETLDRIVAEADKSTRLRCPKCTARLSRAALIRHLWNKHRLVYERGGAREPGPIVEKAVAAYGESRETDSLDRVYAVTEQMYEGVEPKQIHQAILTRLGTTAADPTTLAKAAGEDSCGLCPTCYVALPPGIPPAPAPLVLAGGRLVGEGYAIEALKRKILIAFPDGSVDRLPDPNDRSNAREFAAKVGAGLAGGAFLLAAALPAKPLLPTVGVALAAIGVYAGLLFRERRVPKPDVRALAAAWADLVPGIGRSSRAIRFLSRLCRTSYGLGEPDTRSKPLWELVEHAAVLAEKGVAQTQLFAAARLLQANDSARIGKEWLNQLLGVFEPFLRGEVSPAYAETVAEILLEGDHLSERDAARLRILLPAAAYDAGLTPAGLAHLGNWCPNFGRLLAGNADWLDLLHELWRLKNSRPWENTVGPAQSVFDLTRKGGAKTLLVYPDTLLVADGGELGEILIGRRGVTVGDSTVADPDAPVRIEAGKKATAILVLGPHRIAVEDKLTERSVRLLRGWMKFRADRLMPAAGRSTGTSMPERTRQILEPAIATCPMCSTRSFIRVGEVGQPM
ncbi:MAG: hypothetical protein KF873_04055 [Gemmataceae bacterium]|nr:hypothetical protein [Gemmataceae bacterium]